jgi:Zn-finger nucleic acid-binding protein
MESVIIGNSPLQECPQCEGLWADVTTINQIYNDREQQSAILGTAAPIETNPTFDLEKVRYLPCPVCQEMMNRVNFANCSHVIVDICKAHGTWFDKDELRRIVEFIRGGGMDRARAMEIQQLEDERRQLESARSAPAMDPDYTPASDYSDHHLGLSFAASVLNTLFDSKNFR